MNSLSADSPQPDSEPASAPFRISPSVYFRYAFAGRKAATVTVVCLAIIALLISIAVISGDLRFVLIALMVLFIGVPTAMSFVWFAIALSPEAARSTLLHTVTVRSDGSLFVRWVQEEPAEGNDDDKIAPPGHKLPAPVHISPNQIVGRSISRSHIIYKLCDGQIVIVPLDMINLNCQEICQFGDFV